MENKSKIPIYITLKQLNKLNNVKTKLMQIKSKKYWQFKKIKMLHCLYDVVECLMNYRR